MSFKDDVMFYLSKGRVFNGVNIYENDDEEDQDEFDKEEKDTKKKKCPDCGKEDCECDKDDEKSAVRDAETDKAIKYAIRNKAKSRGKGMAPDFGATPEEGAMYIGAMAASDKKKRDAEKKNNKSIFTKTVADDDDDQYHASISTKTAGADDDDDQYHASVDTSVTVKEDLLSFIR